MTNKALIDPQQYQDRFGRQVAARLSSGTAELPYGISERLRAARVQALARRKSASLSRASSIFASGRAATLTFGEEGLSLWNRVASALPLVALVAGLVLIHAVQDERRASEVAEVDAALLTDDLPPSAYADPGFAQFLKFGKE
jgi:uncharacterized protein DUF3619